MNECIICLDDRPLADYRDGPCRHYHEICRQCINRINTLNGILQCPVCRMNWGAGGIPHRRPARNRAQRQRDQRAHRQRQYNRNDPLVNGRLYNLFNENPRQRQRQQQAPPPPQPHPEAVANAGIMMQVMDFLLQRQQPALQPQPQQPIMTHNEVVHEVQQFLQPYRQRLLNAIGDGYRRPLPAQVNDTFRLLQQDLIVYILSIVNP